MAHRDGAARKCNEVNQMGEGGGGESRELALFVAVVCISCHQIDYRLKQQRVVWTLGNLASVAAFFDMRSVLI